MKFSLFILLIVGMVGTIQLVFAQEEQDDDVIFVNHFDHGLYIEYRKGSGACLSKRPKHITKLRLNEQFKVDAGEQTVCYSFGRDSEKMSEWMEVEPGTTVTISREDVAKLEQD